MVNFLQLHPRIDAGKPNVNLGVLLIEFFELYGCEFNFEKTAIRVRDGGSWVPKSEVQRNLNHFGHQTALLCIEDPLDQSNDVGRSSYGAWVVLNAWKNAYHQLADLVKPKGQRHRNGRSILSQIINISSEVLEYRSWVSTIVSVEVHQMFTSGEDTHPPLHPAPISADDVEPKDLSEYEEKESNKKKKKKSQKEDEDEEAENESNEDEAKVVDANQCSDCLSSVSTGTSGAGSSIVTSSEGSANASSDTVSFVLNVILDSISLNY